MGGVAIVGSTEAKEEEVENDDIGSDSENPSSDGSGDGPDFNTDFS